MYVIEISTPDTAYIYDAWETEPRASLVGIFSERDARKVIALLNKERNRNPMPTKAFLKIPRRVVYRDVAQRYIERYGGKSQWQPTSHDNGYPILLGQDGEERAKIVMFDKFPKPVENHDDIPF